MPDSKQTSSKNKPKLNLPFGRKRTNAGEWAYNHRYAICVTLVAYLLFGIAFVTARIVISKKVAASEIIMDFEDLEKLQKELERAQELNRMLNERYESEPTANKISNENALDEKLLDAHRTNAAEIYDEADEVQRSVRQNAADYMQGLQDEREILDRRDNKDRQIENKRVRGNVTVSYSLSDPVRSALRMPVPAYMCEGGGDVTVRITVNRNGEVTDAEIDSRGSTGNSCLREAALEKARQSLFNADSSAPQRQQGEITYVFIPQ